MGCNDLWGIVSPAVTQRNILSLFLEHFEEKTGSDRVFALGIDASLWMYQATHFARSPKSPHDESAALLIIFHKMAHLLSLPVKVLFVFDGPGRPQKRRNNTETNSAHYLEHGIQDLAEAFGFHWHRAPGEAEAELSELNTRGIVDAVLTDDSDVLLFNARTVIRNYNIKKDGQIVSVVTSDALGAVPEVGLSQGARLLFALLHGTDYNTGVPGFGTRTALAVCRYDMGDELITNANVLSFCQLQDYLPCWRSRLIDTISMDPHHLLPKNSQPLKLAAALPDDFPNILHLRQYTHPLTSWSGSTAQLGFNSAEFKLNEPRVADLAKTCERLFSWATRDGLLKRFTNVVWDGCVLRSILLDVCWFDAIHWERYSNQFDLKAGGTESLSKGAGGAYMRSASYDPTNLVHAATVGMTGAREPKPSRFVIKPMPSPDDAIPGVYGRRRLKVPLMLLVAGRPSLLQHKQATRLSVGTTPHTRRTRNEHSVIASQPLSGAGSLSHDIIDLTVDDKN